MNKKFKKTLGCTYSYSDEFDQIPTKVTAAFRKNSFELSDQEEFVCACWIDQALTPYNSFVIVTDKRIFCKTPRGVDQNYISGISGIELSVLKNIEILSAGNKSIAFHNANLPSKELTQLLFNKMNNLLLDVPKTTDRVSSENKPDSLKERLKKIQDLWESKLISDEEYQIKRTEILKEI